MRNYSKKGFEFSFGWIFALIVGAAIMVLAIYGVVKLINSERNIVDSESALLLGTLLSPLEVSLESAKSLGPINFPTETRIYNGCDRNGEFGFQEISVSTSSGLGNKWNPPGQESIFTSKYIFSTEVIEGKKLYSFSKPYYSPYKTATLTFSWSENQRYCFVNPPSEIRQELENLELVGINVSSTAKECPSRSTSVCFSNTGCSIDVSVNPQNPEIGSVKRDRRTLYFTGPLIYGAILSDPEIYECQIERLSKRKAELAFLYLEKSKYISARSNGCSSALQPSLQTYAETNYKINESKELFDNRILEENLYRDNRNLGCQLWENEL